MFYDWPIIMCIFILHMLLTLQCHFHNLLMYRVIYLYKCFSKVQTLAGFCLLQKNEFGNWLTPALGSGW